MRLADRIAGIEARANAATTGPWEVRDGPAYVGGGADLCIGAGEAWLANMNERHCSLGYGDHSPVTSGHTLEGDINICSFTDEITREQSANAAFIAAARQDVPTLCAVVRLLAEALIKVPTDYEVTAALAAAERLLSGGGE